jgi:hypothetical protein
MCPPLFGWRGDATKMPTADGEPEILLPVIVEPSLAGVTMTMQYWMAPDYCRLGSLLHDPRYQQIAKIGQVRHLL